MVKNDTDLVRLSDIAQAVALLTRLPVRVSDTARGGAAAWAYPIVGLIVGGIAALVGVMAHWSGLPDIAVALLCLATLVIVTGALHEDGLADTADGLWGGWTREKRLEIMKDSHIGTYGVLTLIVITVARWIALWLLFQTGIAAAVAALLAACMLSRATMPSLMATLPHARDTGLSHSVGSTSRASAAIAWAIALAAALLLTGGGAIWAALWAGMICGAIAMIARRKIGGQTGDILGATQQISEVVVLFSLLT
ncbi:adenosylcobinamide-GDP ribazoletransferase [uncultured Roseovarius sp.]|uniref:adenosylcobinamide-GDP ribazoletransferase n=1 Tax=uncultured Roseovarius sp. TaxID=293344 RepID=UPI002627B3A2|nr:adenosylcobinamide-GDP ribazoletransferase [uncultured Roseovarius sp.]